MNKNTILFRAAQKFVDLGMKHKETGQWESASGPGSSVEAAKNALELIRGTVLRRNIRSILDLGCGDWNWMRRLSLPDLGENLSVSYEGWDANEEMVADLQRSYGSSLIRFEKKDITANRFPEVDLIIARDVLFHMDQSLAVEILERAKTSARYLISTSFNERAQHGEVVNRVNIDGWRFYKVNLNLPPFNLSDYLVEAVCEDDSSDAENKRYICLYNFG